MTTLPAHDSDSSINLNVLSARDLALRNSSPISVLLVSMSLIFGCVFLIFVIWSRNRKRSLGRDSDSTSGVDFKDIDFGLEYPSPSHLNLVHADEKSHDQPLRVEMKALSKPEFIISDESEDESEQREVPTSSELRQILSKSKSLETLTPDVRHAESRVEIHESANITIESLASAHRRQLEQRERFIHDRHNIGLRHIAIKQILNQQQTEKKIMRIRRFGATSCVGGANTNSS